MWHNADFIWLYIYKKNVHIQDEFMALEPFHVYFVINHPYQLNVSVNH